MDVNVRAEINELTSSKYVVRLSVEPWMEQVEMNEDLPQRSLEDTL